MSALLGYPAAGTWNTTPGGVNGALNTLGAEIAIDFDLAVTSLAVDVLALPDASGAPGSVLLLAFAGASLVAFDVSDPSATGDSGLPEDTLAVAGAGITHALLCAPSPNDPTSCLAPGIPTTLWIDRVRFEPVPELEHARTRRDRPRRLRGGPEDAMMRHRHALVLRAPSAVGALALSVASLLSCTPRPQILAPADQGSIALDGSAAVEVSLGQVIAAPGVRITLLRGIDAPPATIIDLTALGRVGVAGSTATAQLSAADLLPGRNAL